MISDSMMGLPAVNKRVKRERNERKPAINITNLLKTASIYKRERGSG